MAEKERGGKVIDKTLNVAGTFQLGGATVTSTAAELNAVAGTGIVAADATKLHAITAAAATINQVAAAAGTVNFDRSIKVALVPLVGTTIHAATMGWTNPEAGDILINRVALDTGFSGGAKSTGAGTLSVGTTATSVTTASQNLMDTVDVGTAAGVFDNITNKGTLGKSIQRLAAGKFVTFSQQTGDTTGMVGNAYVFYTNV